LQQALMAKLPSDHFPAIFFVARASLKTTNGIEDLG